MYSTAHEMMFKEKRKENHLPHLWELVHYRCPEQFLSDQEEMDK